jgi:hypothetical protein
MVSTNMQCSHLGIPNNGSPANTKPPKYPELWGKLSPKKLLPSAQVPIYISTVVAMRTPLALAFTPRLCSKSRNIFFTSHFGYHKFRFIATMAAEQRLANKTALVTGMHTTSLVSCLFLRQSSTRFSLLQLAFNSSYYIPIIMLLYALSISLASSSISSPSPPSSSPPLQPNSKTPQADPPASASRSQPSSPTTAAP